MRFSSFILYLLLGVSNSILAQTPQGVSYQAVAFDNSGNAIVNSTVGIQISILNNSATGPAVYVETHTSTTNAQGLFSLSIGQGTATLGSFSNIDWSIGSKHLKVEIDPAGGSNYTITGANQLMSVPYALYSENTNENNISNSNIVENGSMIVVYTSSAAYGFTRNNAGTPNWYNQSLTGTPLGAVATDSSVVVYTSSTAYGFTLSNAGTPNWYSQSLTGTPIRAEANDQSIVVYTTSTAYGFTRSNAGTPNWYSQSISGNTIGGTSNPNAVVVYSNNTAYGFMRSNAGTPTWYSQSLTGTPIDAVSAGRYIVVYTTNTAYGFTRSNAGTPNWYSRSITGTPLGASPK